MKGLVFVHQIQYEFHELLLKGNILYLPLNFFGVVENYVALIPSLSLFSIAWIVSSVYLGSISVPSLKMPIVKA